VVQRGAPAHLYERPANRFVAHFLGESNLESGRIEAAAGPRAWRVDAGGLPVVATGDGAFSPGDAVAVAVRPERIRIRPTAADRRPGANAFPATVEECVFRGALRRYRVRLPHGGVWSVDEPAQAAAPPHAAGAGVDVAWRPEDCLALPET
jgi:ABC-type Fe3+/spermidine/putrescine transport system ATPase subunit